MKLTDIIGEALTTNQVILVGKPEVSNIMDRDNKPYLVFKTKQPVVVRCSTNPNIISYETEEVYVRQSDAELDSWVEAEDGIGFNIPGWLVDFSTNHGIPIYQAETIQQWVRKQRKEKQSTHTTEINERLKSLLKHTD